MKCGGAVFVSLIYTTFLQKKKNYIIKSLDPSNKILNRDRVMQKLLCEISEGKFSEHDMCEASVFIIIS